MTILRNRFDFDIGYLVKSPCRDCTERRRFPDCMDACAVLDHVQRLLAAGISCSRSYSTLEDHAVGSENGRMP
jgi:hypothetical protein